MAFKNRKKNVLPNKVNATPVGDLDTEWGAALSSIENRIGAFDQGVREAFKQLEDWRNAIQQYAHSLETESKKLDQRLGGIETREREQADKSASLKAREQQLATRDSKLGEREKVAISLPERLELATR